MLTVIHVGFGALIGLRFPIGAFLPIALGIAVEAVVLMSSIGFFTGLMTGIFLFFAFQLGYLASLLGRAVLEARNVEGGALEPVSRIGR